MFSPKTSVPALSNFHIFLLTCNSKSQTGRKTKQNRTEQKTKKDLNIRVCQEHFWQLSETASKYWFCLTQSMEWITTLKSLIVLLARVRDTPEKEDIRIIIFLAYNLLNPVCIFWVQTHGCRSWGKEFRLHFMLLLFHISSVEISVASAIKVQCTHCASPLFPHLF